LVIDVGRDAYAAGIGTLQPGRDVDAIAIDPLATDDHIAQVDTDAEPHVAAGREVAVF
jgi:hypothetical protein